MIYYPELGADERGRNGLTGHAVVWHRTELPMNLTGVSGTKAGQGGWTVVYKTAALRDDDNEYATELRAIRKALRISCTQTPWTREGNITFSEDRRVLYLAL